MGQLINFLQAIEYEMRGRWGNSGVTYVYLFALLALCIIALTSLGFLIDAKLKHLRFKKKYSSIISLEDETAKKNQEIDLLNKKAYALIEDHKKAQELYKKMSEELALIEENYEAISFGVYRPHYDFKTSTEYGLRLERIYDQKKQMVRDKQAIICDKEWAVGGDKRAGQKAVDHYSKLMLRAFNGELDAAVLKVNWNNISRMKDRLENAFKAINKLGETLSISITVNYFNLAIEELELTYEHEEKLHQEKEEQRKIQQQMREEAKVQIEIEKAKREAEEEEIKYQKALSKARCDIEKAKGKEIEELNNAILALEQKLREAHELKERAISRAELTKSGHVYIISNIGSFGENVFKIGMTRRLEPYDRIKELGDASVPFEFDVHAMIYSENAPALEAILHEHFVGKRVNLINPRKEFFNVLIEEIEEVCREKNVRIELTRIAEAREYRETLALREKHIAAQESLSATGLHAVPLMNTL